ncbi:nucleotide exchange factor GrpE [Nocardioides euryhalodurans]|uniref:Protein GrpE n=2 Tax=Nocardioides euryhalodurans TaxID=2518370 RepID=A0A4P7GR20_9ACTN|nr:nucleotide exchange factor GrpE [Nocardioides euryhalodurans]
MANETEVEAALREQAASAPAAEEPAEGQDISGVDNWVEEGGPLEPSDVAEVEQEVAAAGDDVAVALAERTADLQRLQAEFLNYKRRVDRDRELHAENARYQVLVPIIEVLDTVDRAKEHGDLDDGFRAVAEQLERVVTGLGLARFGEVGEPFDPNLHEALSHIGEDPDVAVTTCKVIAKAGYRIGDRVVRAAQVLVVDPAS